MKRRQLDLFTDYAPPCQAHSPTSRDAAQAIEPRTETLRRAVLDYIRRCGDEGATDEQVQDALAMSGSTQRPRRVELQEMGLVIDSGKTRPTKSGRKAVVWVPVSSRVEDRKR